MPVKSPAKVKRRRIRPSDEAQMQLPLPKAPRAPRPSLRSGDMFERAVFSPSKPKQPD